MSLLVIKAHCSWYDS